MASTAMDIHSYRDGGQWELQSRSTQYPPRCHDPMEPKKEDRWWFPSLCEDPTGHGEPGRSLVGRNGRVLAGGKQTVSLRFRLRHVDIA